jgi:transcriptional regulator with XRE-family HTH domain
VNDKGLSILSAGPYDSADRQEHAKCSRNEDSHSMPIGDKIKELRIRNKQSLQQVADSVGVSKAHIWEMERGTSANPGLELVKKLAEHFKVTVAYLADDAMASEKAAPLQFFREFEGKLTEKDWEALRTVAGRLTDKGD